MTNQTTGAELRPFRQRLVTSPMRDLVRRRITGRLDLTIYPERAGLPTALADLVVRIAKKTHLRSLEKVDVARELSAHFAEGVAAGKTTDELIDHFGDIHNAVKLIRRAKKRNRSRVIRVTVRTAGSAFAVVFFLYASVLLWYLFAVGAVNPSHDYLADVNAVAAAVPQKDRAWPVYREAFIHMGTIPQDVTRCEGPADYRWPQTIAFLDSHKSELEQIRLAAAMDGLGYVSGLQYNEADRPLLDPEGKNEEAHPDEHSTSVIPMVEILRPQLGYLNQAAQLLQLQSLQQLESGSADGVIANIRAILGIATHTGEQESLISQLVRIGIHAIAVQTADQLLAHRGESLTDEELQSLDDLFNPKLVGDLCTVNLQGERYLLLDLEQHIYTDNGHGNGRVRLEALANVFGEEPSFDTSPFLAAPFSAVMPNRKTFHAQGEELYDAADRDLEKPMWERDHGEMTALLDRIQSTPWKQIRWSFLTMLIPGVEHALSTAGIAAMDRDAIRTTIAQFRYKVVEGHWPTDLSVLVPRYLEALPIDRFDGRPIRYKLDEQGMPVLYSVGADLDDDQGAPAHDDDGWPTNDGASRWISPSRLAQLQATPARNNHWSSHYLVDGDFILWPPLPEKPFEPEPDPYADIR